MKVVAEMSNVAIVPGEVLLPKIGTESEASVELLVCAVKIPVPRSVVFVPAAPIAVNTTSDSYSHTQLVIDSAHSAAVDGVDPTFGPVGGAAGAPALNRTKCCHVGA